MDWQTLIVYLILASACFFVGRRILNKVRSISGSTKNGCDTGCGKCGTQTSGSKLLEIKRR